MNQPMMSLLPTFERRSWAEDCLHEGKCPTRRRRFRIRPSVIIALVISAATVAAAFRAESFGAYLPTVGPAPLRFESIPAHPLSLAPDWFAPKTNPKTNKVDSVESAPKTAVATPQDAASPDTTDTKIVTRLPVKTNEVAVAALSTNQPEATPLETTPFQSGLSTPLSPSDVPTVTPQMLTDFLMLAQEGTNKASVYVPANIRFIPPLSQGESRAIYKSQ